jgi:hypothetical protein
LKGKYKKKREHQKHQEGAATPIKNNQSGAPITGTHPEEALRSKPKEIDMPAFRRWIRSLETTEIAVAGLFVTVIIAAIYFFQLLSMQDTVTAMEKQTRLSVRPWVGLDEGLNAIQTTALVIDKDGNAGLNYIIHAKNYSNTPAANVWATAQLVVADDLNTVYKQQDFVCTDAMIGKPDIGMVLFQGRDREFVSYPSTTKIDIKHENSMIGVWMAGCIAYRDQFNYLCRTKFIWGYQDDAGHGVTLQAPVPAQTIMGHFVPTASGNAIDTCQIPKYNYGEGIYKKTPKNPN